MDANILLYISTVICVLMIAAGYQYNKPFCMANAATYAVCAILLYVRFDTDRNFPDVINNFTSLLLFNILIITINTVYLVSKLMKKRSVG